MAPKGDPTHLWKGSRLSVAGQNNPTQGQHASRCSAVIAVAVGALAFMIGLWDSWKHRMLGRMSRVWTDPCLGPSLWSDTQGPAPTSFSSFPGRRHLGDR